MVFTEVILVALALAVDAFTVGVAVGISHRQPRQIFRLSFHFGLFQALLPLLGAVLGAWMSHIIASVTHWVAFVMLSLVGGKMIYESRRKDENEFYAKDPTRGLTMVMLSVAVSIDALAVGFTLGLQDVSIFWVVSVIGVVAALATLVGMKVAGKIAAKVGHKLEPFAGVVLIALGVKAVIEHYCS
ncbi:MAG: manganese efflux pump [Deltaproteobacteria bacterium]|nr:manganese efflux pump [Deltaproteobacteria bacterium]MBN2674574.1 manganese efflux pump [Deltaproteobacteria bacterium]